MGDPDLLGEGVSGRTSIAKEDVVRQCLVIESSGDEWSAFGSEGRYPRDVCAVCTSAWASRAGI